MHTTENDSESHQHNMKHIFVDERLEALADRGAVLSIIAPPPGESSMMWRVRGKVALEEVLVRQTETPLGLQIDIAFEIAQERA